MVAPTVFISIIGDEAGQSLGLITDEGVSSKGRIGIVEIIDRGFSITCRGRHGSDWNMLPVDRGNKEAWRIMARHHIATEHNMKQYNASDRSIWEYLSPIEMNPSSLFLEFVRRASRERPLRDSQSGKLTDRPCGFFANFAANFLTLLQADPFFLRPSPLSIIVYSESFLGFTFPPSSVSWIVVCLWSPLAPLN